jgi:hypothetical protein
MHWLGFSLRRQRDFHVHKSQRLVGGGHEVFALDHGEQGEDLVVQHFPGADLLLNHVETGLFVVHGGPVGWRDRGRSKGRKRGDEGVHEINL